MVPTSYDPPPDVALSFSDSHKLVGSGVEANWAVFLLNCSKIHQAEIDTVVAIYDFV